MTRTSPRATMLMAAATAALTTIAGTNLAEASDIQGTVAFADDAAIPKGRIEIYIDDPAAKGARRPDAAATQVESDGGSRTIAFTLAAPADAPATQVVARLEREDGFLLARGSAALEPGAPTTITLYTVMY